MKKLLVILMSLIMVLSMAVPVMAAEKAYVIDEADKITLASEAELNAQAKDFADKTGVDLVFMDTTGDQLPSSLMDTLKADYADDAVIMIHNIDNNKVATQAYGKADKILDDDALDELFEVYNAADTYKKGAADYFALAEKKLIASGEFKDTEGSEDFTDLAPEITEPVDETLPTQEQTVPDHRLKDRLVDDADLLTKDQEKRILEQLDAMSEEKQMDVAICFTDSFDQPTVVQAADDYFAYNGFGIGEEREGILMYVCMNTRDIYFATQGPNTISSFTVIMISNMVGEVGPYLTLEQYGA
ncbi:MAG: TPM domain-containing protein, partial [Eubacterium sp.]|nr:TPM domain-containing protein [Candidatus Colimonas fimequi]